MMFPSLTEALHRIEDVQGFVDLSRSKFEAAHEIRKAQGAPGGCPASVLKWANAVTSSSSPKVHDYACAIILTYGLYEQFVQDLSQEYLDLLVAGSKTRDDLPDRLVREHFSLTVEQLVRSNSNKYQERSSSEMLLKSLAGAVAGTQLTDFCTEPFLRHTANFRSEFVDEYLARLGVPNATEHIRNTPSFRAYLKSDPAPKVHAGVERLRLRIDDLVRRRNQVAHGDLSDILSLAEVKEFIESVKVYITALARVVRDQLTASRARDGIPLGKPIAVHNANIVCLSSKGHVLQTGSVLLCKVSGGRSYSLIVKEVQQNNASISATPKQVAVDVGLETDGTCKDTHDVFLIPPLNYPRST